MDNPFQSLDSSSSQVRVSEPIMKGYRDPGWISLATGLSIILLLILNAVAIPGNMMERNVLLKIQAGDYETEREMVDATNMSDTIQGGIGIVGLVALLVGYILFFFWTYRIVKNAHCLTYRPMRFGPGWAIGYYFIPILNLFRPYQALSDAHRVSKNPSDWMAASGSSLLGWWWLFHILSGIVGNFIMRASFRDHEIDGLIQLNLASTISTLMLDIPYLLLVLLVVQKVCRSQQEAHQQVVYSPPPQLEPEMYVQSLPAEDTWLIPSRTSGWAIAAGYAGMFAVLFFPAPIALILGVIALQDCKKRSSEGAGRAIFAIIMGTLFSLLLVCFGILAFLAV